MKDMKEIKHWILCKWYHQLRFFISFQTYKHYSQLNLDKLEKDAQK